MEPAPAGSPVGAAPHSVRPVRLGGLHGETLLRRLCEKGAVVLERRGMYRAVITQAQYGRWSARHLVDQVFNGSAKKLVASLLSDGQLSQAEIAELSALFHQEEST